MTQATHRDMCLEEFAETVGVADYESSPFLAPRMRGHEPQSPVARSIEILTESLHHEVVVPILRVKSREEYWERITGCWKKFDETQRAFRALQRASMSDFRVDPEERIKELREQVRLLSGPEAVDEFDFDVGTYNRAATLARYVASSPLNDPQHASKDREFAHGFNAHCGLFQLAFFVLAVAAASHHATGVAVEVTFEILRGSAMRAYAAVRQGAELRKAPNSAAIEFAPFDAEDLFLASIAT